LLSAVVASINFGAAPNLAIALSSDEAKSPVVDYGSDGEVGAPKGSAAMAARILRISD
jgi:hypothetical protein